MKFTRAEAFLVIVYRTKCVEYLTYISIACTSQKVIEVIISITKRMKKITMQAIAFCIVLFCGSQSKAQNRPKKFNVIAFYTAKNDAAHISFVHEANRWFPTIAAKYNFTYDSTNNWNNLNYRFLSRYAVVLFLDTRPDSPAQREAFEKYMKHGGAWMGFHFAAFALTPSAYPENWDWYHNEFLGSGSYVSNTWRPT